MAIAYRDSLRTVTIVVLAAVFLFAGLAYSQEPALPSTGARTRLVVGLAQSPPFCMRSEDGSPRRKPVDRALLHRLASPAWRDLVYRYLGAAE